MQESAHFLVSYILRRRSVMDRDLLCRLAGMATRVLELCEVVAPPANAFTACLDVSLSFLPEKSINSALRSYGCSRGAAKSLERIFNAKCAQLRATCGQHMVEAWSESAATIPAGDAVMAARWKTAITTAMVRQYERSVQALQECLEREVRAAQLRHSSSSSPAPSASSFDPHDTRHFAPHILSFLQSAFDSHPTRRLNKTERKELARAAGLSEKQVSTWVRWCFLPPSAHVKQELINSEPTVWECEAEGTEAPRAGGLRLEREHVDGPAAAAQAHGERAHGTLRHRNGAAPPSRGVVRATAAAATEQVVVFILIRQQQPPRLVGFLLVIVLVRRVGLID